MKEYKYYYYLNGIKYFIYCTEYEKQEFENKYNIILYLSEDGYNISFYLENT